MHGQLATIGSWEGRFSQEAVTIPREGVRTIEAMLDKAWKPTAMKWYREVYSGENGYEPTFAMRNFGAPSCFGRIDMAPVLNFEEGGPYPDVYEFDCNPPGISFAEHVGVRVAEPVARAFRELGLDEIEYGAAASRREAQIGEHVMSMRLLEEHGLKVREWDGNRENDSLLWLRAGEEDHEEMRGLHGRSLILNHHSGGHKGYLLQMSNAALLRDIDPFSDEGRKRFPTGFTLKSLGSWGAKTVEVYATQKPWKDRTSTKKKIETLIQEIRARGDDANWLVQGFVPPEAVQVPGKEGKPSTEFRIWRIFFVLTPRGYQLLGGVWNHRPSLKVHGAKDTTWGAVHVAK